MTVSPTKEPVNVRKAPTKTRPKHTLQILHATFIYLIHFFFGRGGGGGGRAEDIGTNHQQRLVLSGMYLKARPLPSYDVLGTDCIFYVQTCLFLTLVIHCTALLIQSQWVNKYSFAVKIDQNALFKLQ